MWRRSPNNSAPAPAGLARRTIALAIDAAAGCGVALLLASTAGRFFARRAVVTLHIGDPHSLWKGPLPFLLGAIGEVVYLLPFALLLVWLVEPLTGATLGKRIAGLRIRGRDGQPATAAQRWTRSALQTALLWLSALAFVVGSWQLLLVAIAGAGPSLAFHDVVSGTRCIRS